MAQYRHSRLVSLKLAGGDGRGRTFGGTMIAFIFALLFVLIIAGIISIGITFTTDSMPDYNEYRDVHLLSGTLALDGPYSSHVNNNWTFVPNVTPETVKTWNNASKAPEYQHFIVDEKDCYSAAYVGHFECSEEINSLSLTFHKYNGMAWIFCNGEFIQKIGDRTPIFNLKAFADYCTLIPDDGKLDRPDTSDDV